MLLRYKITEIFVQDELENINLLKYYPTILIDEKKALRFL